MARASRRPCSRPGCPTPAQATLRLRYDAQEVLLAELDGERDPQSYDLCTPHADRTTPPRGWDLRDERPSADEEEAPLDSAETVAVLREALRGAGGDARPGEAPPTGAVTTPDHAGTADEGPADPAADRSAGTQRGARPVLAVRGTAAVQPASAADEDDTVATPAVEDTSAADTMEADDGVEAGGRDHGGGAPATGQMTIDDALAAAEAPREAPDDGATTGPVGATPGEDRDQQADGPRSPDAASAW